MTEAEALELFKRDYKYCIENLNCNEEYTGAMKIAINAHEKQVSSGWIPCSERLPEEPKENKYFDGKPLWRQRRKRRLKRKL